jgi:hypothetical protein
MMKKRKFGSGGMPSMKESMESGNRVSRQVGAETKKLMPATRSTRPSVGDAIASGNRMSKKNAEDLKAVKKYAKGGMTKKRYADGGGVGEMGRAGLDLEAKARTGETLRELDRMDFSVPKVEAPDKKQSFGAAFAAARKRGDKTFTWNGGSYGTQMKGEGTKPIKSTKTTPPMSVAKEDKEIVVTGKRNQKPTPAASTKAAGPSVGLRNTSVGRDYADTLSKERVRNANSNQKLVDRYKKEGRPNLAKVVSYLSGAKYAKGGVTRADGCAVRGKTKGKMR